MMVGLKQAIRLDLRMATAISRVSTLTKFYCKFQINSKCSSLFLLSHRRQPKVFTCQK